MIKLVNLLKEIEQERREQQLEEGWKENIIAAAIAASALVGGVSGNSGVFLIATSFALGAAFLNAAFGFCLGCQFYLLILRGKARLSAQN